MCVGAADDCRAKSYLELEVLRQALGPAEGVDADELELDVLLEQAGQDARDLRRRRRPEHLHRHLPRRRWIDLPQPQRFAKRSRTNLLLGTGSASSGGYIYASESEKGDQIDQNASAACFPAGPYGQKRKGDKEAKRRFKEAASGLPRCCRLRIMASASNRVKNFLFISLHTLINLCQRNRYYQIKLKLLPLNKGNN